MAGKRKADKFAKSSGSLANRLMRRRQLLEGGRPMAAQKVGRKKTRKN